MLEGSICIDADIISIPEVDIREIISSIIENAK